jgi:cyclopropane-fatty-acyl-phospholipid synthase
VFTLEQSKTAYRLDFIILGGACVALAAALLRGDPPAPLWASLAYAAVGLAAWSLMEYGLHRFILHGMKPFSTWHAEHHRRPGARIQSPTYVTVGFMAALIYLPTWLVLGAWPACAFTFGVTLGDLLYSVMHGALHRRGADGWLGRRRRWHGLHHASSLTGAGGPGYYGVTSPLWDHVFRTAFERGGRRFSRQ